MWTRQKQRHHSRSKAKEARRREMRHIQHKASAKNRKARVLIDCGKTPHWELLVGWARARVDTQWNWYDGDGNTPTNRCRICGEASAAPARLRWMWLVSHAEFHAKKLGLESVNAFYALLAMRREPRIFQQVAMYECFVEIFGEAKQL